MQLSQLSTSTHLRDSIDASFDKIKQEVENCKFENE